MVYGTPPASTSASWATFARRYPLSGSRSAPTIDTATWWPTPASRSAASRLRVEVVKNSRTASSSQTGALATSTTTSAPIITSASPSPVIVSTPVAGEAGTGSCPCVMRRRTTLLPIRPLPPMTTIFMTFLLTLVDAIEDRRTACHAASVGPPSRTPSVGLGRHQRRLVVRQRASQLTPRADVELREDFAQVVLNRAGADEQLRADLGIGAAVGGQPRDLRLLGGEVVARLGGPAGHGLAGGQQFATGAFGERLGPGETEHLVRSTQLPSGVHAAAVAAEPFAVEQTSAGELDPNSGALEPLDRLTVESIGVLPLDHQRP